MLLAPPGMTTVIPSNCDLEPTEELQTPSAWWLMFYGILTCSYEPGSKLVVLGMAIPPLIGNPYNGYINPYYWVDDGPLLYGNNGSLDPSTYEIY